MYIDSHIYEIDCWKETKSISRNGLMNCDLQLETFYIDVCEIIMETILLIK